jgi:hypothetical protein
MWIVLAVLAPDQAKAWRPPGGAWRTSAVEPGRAYRCPFPSGRSIDLFFYDGATAQAVAFERLLDDGRQIIARMTNRGLVEGGGPTLGHIATDGETYSHHHRYGDMALTWALAQVEQSCTRAVDRLSAATSNLAEQGDGRRVWAWSSRRGSTRPRSAPTSRSTRSSSPTR